MTCCCHCCDASRKPIRLELDLGPEFYIPRKPHITGGYTVYKLAIDRGTYLTLRPKDAKGNDVPLDMIDNETIAVSSSNPEIVTAELLEDQRIKILPVGPLGTSQVNVTLTIPGDTPHEFNGFLEIQTVPGGVASFTLEPGGDFPIG